MKRLFAVYASHNRVCGISTWLGTLATQLQNIGWDVVIGLTKGRKFHDPELFRANWPNLKTISMDASTGTPLGRRRAVERAVRKTQPDIVLVTILDDAMRQIAAMRTKGRVKKFVLASHDNAPEHLAGITEIGAFADAIVTVNKISRSLFQQWPGRRWNPGIVHSIPNSIEGPCVARSPRKQALRIGFVGRLAGDKGVEFLAPIVAGLIARKIDFHLTIAGDGPMRNVATELASTYSMVNFLGPVAKTFLYEDVYPNLDIILGCSPSEGWPQAIAEAMVNGVIPVTSAFTGIHEEGIIRHGETGLIYPYGDVRAAVIRLGTVVGSLSKLSANASEEIARNFTPDLFINRWDQLLEDLLVRPGRSMPCFEPDLNFTYKDQLKEFARRLVNMKFPHDSVRSEWPMFHPRESSVTEQVRAALSASTSGGTD